MRKAKIILVIIIVSAITSGTLKFKAKTFCDVHLFTCRDFGVDGDHCTIVAPQNYYCPDGGSLLIPSATVTHDNLGLTLNLDCDGFHCTFDLQPNIND